MATAGIRETISTALQAERDTGLLRQKLERQLPQLSQLLVLPEETPVDALMSFICGYVESVPGCLNLVTAVSKRLGFHDYATLAIESDAWRLAAVPSGPALLWGITLM